MPDPPVDPEVDEPRVDRMCRAIVETSTLIYYVVDADGRIIYANPASEHLLGYSSGEILGMAATELIHPEDLDIALAALSQIVETGDGHRRKAPPMAMRITNRSGGVTYFDVGAVDRLTDPDVLGVIIRGRPMNGQQLLDQALESLVASSPLEEVLSYVQAGLTADLPGSGVAIAYDWDGHQFASAVGGGPAMVTDGTEHATGLPWLEAIAQRAIVIHPDLTQLPGAVRSEAKAAGWQACWASPAIVPEDETLRACLVVWREVEGQPWVSQRVSLDRATQLTALALTRRHHETRLVHAAHHDDLTGVANRAKFFEYLEHVTAAGDHSAAVLYIDLDGFKQVNDRLGHAVGDEVLKVVTDRISAHLRPGDLLARLGGDEFAVVCTGLDSPVEAETVAQRLVAAIDEPAHIDGSEVRVGLSIGVALASRDIATETPGGVSAAVKRLVEAADAALYEAKQSGKGRYRVAH
jgi:diguanylate cyclase (GGDEF)-like protein/PAS domain S-box-containing protein